MKRWLAVVAVAAMLAVPAVTAGSWTQGGSDAGSTGAPDNPGPRINQTAFTVELPGEAAGTYWAGNGYSSVEPVIHDGYTYVAVVDRGGGDDDATGIARVNLDTAEVELFVDSEYSPDAIALADGKLLLVRYGGMDAYDLETGEQVWSVDVPSPGRTTVGSAARLCVMPAVADGTVVVPCLDGFQSKPFVWAADVETGEVQWGRVLGATSQQQDGVREALPGEVRGGAAAVGSWSLGVSISGGKAFPITIENGQGFSDSWSRYTVRSMDLGSGEIHWNKSTRIAAYEEAYPKLAPRATATPQTIYTNLDGRLEAINPTGDEPITRWTADIGQEDTSRETYVGATSALVDDRLYAASTQSVYRFDVAAETEVWRVAVDLGEEVASGSLIASDGIVYALSFSEGFEYHAFYAFDAETGEKLWRHQLQAGETDDRPGSRFNYAVSEGVLVAAGTDGSFHVIGRTEASLGEPDVDASTAYPPPGEQVRVDLSGTEPGALGNATRYKADWGDGNATGWRLVSTLTHTYETPGEQTARFWVTNEAGQTTSTTHTFHVGQEAPAEPNWIEERFEKDNQDMTFGILGVALALGGGAVGVARRRRKRSNLEAELEALEEGFEQMSDRPSECEPFLDSRKARARSLALDGKLEEDQVGIIENRAEELRGQLRAGALEEEFAFLPHGLVTKARRMVEDGDVTSLERDAFLRAVEEDEMLTDEQKSIVRERIERWHGRDKGGGVR